MEFSVSIEIAAPPDVVWPVMSDVERWHEWTASIRRVHLFGRRPIGIGSRALVRQPRLPPALWRVTALSPGRSFSWTSGGPGLRVRATHTVVPTLTGSRASLSITYDGVGGRLLGRLTRGINERYLELEAAGLKRRSEERAARGAGSVPPS